MKQDFAHSRADRIAQAVLAATQPLILLAGVIAAAAIAARLAGGL